MLKKIILKNFRLFEQAEIQFNNLAVFIGQNSSGKSSIADILDFLSNLFSYYNNILEDRYNIHSNSITHNTNHYNILINYSNSLNSS